MSTTHGADVIKFFRPSHSHNSNCVGCAESCSNVGLPSLAWTFEPCGCDETPYARLVERLWHKPCLLRSLAEEVSV